MDRAESARGTMPGGGFTEQIDASMERASAALSRTDYFEAEHLALRALRTAHNSQDHERMARICMPLQEARRQIRQAACDAGSIAVLDTQTALNDVLVADPSDFQPGCYLVQPPLIGLDGKTVREVILRSRVPVMVITREPRTRAGKWPVVAVGKTTIRAQVDPPADAKPDDKIMAKDRIEGPPPVSWFENASEQLGDQAIRMIDTGLHPWYQVDDLMEVLESVPQHEKLHQALMATCRAAFEAGEPTEPRPRSRDDDLRSF